ncbi:unnamed protein product [Caenorhabditis auriculariae]|uniref:SXP/RAL-2 family protein Ani s 5-like cation-binding domain-containing protein n=1 Tax=Caenorhabditis auriculariae TaxID=2777116 RepID=A0A8S1HYR2_9PELO|nr:unnamed protein product [Caenorhabditis auriculariae]
MLKVLIVCAFGAVAVLAEQKEPSFLANVKSDDKKEFLKIQNDAVLTISEIDTKLAAWAKKHNVNAYNKYKTDLNNIASGAFKKVDETVNNFPKAAAALKTILRNKNQTYADRKKALDKLQAKYPYELQALSVLRNRYIAEHRHGAKKAVGL